MSDHQSNYMESNATQHYDHKYAWVQLSQGQISTIIGLLPHERIHTQKILIDLHLAIAEEDFIQCACQANLDLGVDYGLIWQWIQFVVQSAEFKLLESLAYVITSLCLSEPFPSEKRARIYASRLTISKPEILSTCVPQIKWDHTLAHWKTVGGYYENEATDSTWHQQVIINSIEVKISRIYRVVPKITHQSSQQDLSQQEASHKSISFQLTPQQSFFVMSGTWSLMDHTDHLNNTSSTYTQGTLWHDLF